jgi:hypothetical protein
MLGRLLTGSLLDRHKIEHYFWSAAARRRFGWPDASGQGKALTRQRTPNKACRSYYETANNWARKRSARFKNTPKGLLILAQGMKSGTPKVRY